MTCDEVNAGIGRGQQKGAKRKASDDWAAVTQQNDMAEVAYRPE